MEIPPEEAEEYLSSSEVVREGLLEASHPATAKGDTHHTPDVYDSQDVEDTAGNGAAATRPRRQARAG